ncbi:S8 family serine peptidase [Streptomyces sp. NPDC002032]|uniref:S8 family peptidase n=2 Tax=unclassified Streptomyces TaxID=2593676 RepID=UPI0036C749A3
MTAMTALLPAAALLAASTVLPPHSAHAADAPTAPYVVVLKDTTARAPARALAAEAAQAGDRVGAVYDAALSGFAVRTTAARAAELSADPRVASVEPDTVYRLSDPPDPAPAAVPTPVAPPAPVTAPAPAAAPTPTPATAPAPAPAPVPSAAPAPVPVPAAVVQAGAPWPLDRIDQRELPLDGGYTYATRAQGVTVYVVDTGINTLHQEFGGRARAGYNAVWTEGAADCNGHGTHVAATVGGATYGVAKGVSLVGVKVADCRGDGRLSAILRGLDWMVKDAVKTAAKGGPVVANMSMGGTRSRAMDAAVTRAVASGITFTVAAGNAGKDACGGSPSGVPAALTVGATDAADRRPAFSNHGRCVDISAPGVSVISAWKGSATAVARATGTSMAAPHVAGVAALILAGGTARTPEQVRQALVRGAVSDRITGLPAGTPNLLLHVPTDR